MKTVKKVEITKNGVKITTYKAGNRIYRQFEKVN
jgi:hypothetical protein